MIAYFCYPSRLEAFSRRIKSVCHPLVKGITVIDEKDTTEPPTTDMEHKMPGMAEDQKMDAGVEHKMHDMGAGLQPGKSHKVHRGRHEGHVTEDFKRRFIISLIVTIPTLALSTFIQELFRFKLEFSGSIYVLFLLSTFVYFYGGYPFLKGFFNEIQDKNIG